MVFVDNLAISLLAVSFVGALTLYMTVRAYLGYRKGAKDPCDDVIPGMLTLAGLGVFVFGIGLIGELTWPLPGSYNILYFDPLMMLGVILVSFAISVVYRRKTQYAGLLALLAGAMVAYYGIVAYGLGLSKDPLVLLALYLSFGTSAMLSYPVTLIFDIMSGKGRRASRLWDVVLVLFWISLVVATVMSGAMGAAATAAHLLSAP
jgi:putative membrane protein